MFSTNSLFLTWSLLTLPTVKRPLSADNGTALILKRCDIVPECRININISVLWALLSQLGASSRSIDLSIIDLRIFQRKRSQLQPKSLFGREARSRERP